MNFRIFFLYFLRDIPGDINGKNLCIFFILFLIESNYAVADPGFPIGGRAPIRGAWTSDVGTFRLKVYAKMKELGHIGGHVPGTPPLDPQRLCKHKKYSSL